jgi:hypothetical protein
MNKRTLTLAPLSFDQAVTEIMKIKPEPKKRPKGKKIPRTQK